MRSVITFSALRAATRRTTPARSCRSSASNGRSARGPPSVTRKAILAARLHAAISGPPSARNAAERWIAARPEREQRAPRPPQAGPEIPSPAPQAPRSRGRPARSRGPAAQNAGVLPAPPDVDKLFQPDRIDRHFIKPLNDLGAMVAIGKVGGHFGSRLAHARQVSQRGPHIKAAFAYWGGFWVLAGPAEGAACFAGFRSGEGLPLPGLGAGGSGGTREAPGRERSDLLWANLTGLGSIWWVGTHPTLPSSKTHQSQIDQRPSP